MLIEISQKNQTNTKFYFVDSNLLFKIASFRLNESTQFIFFDYTYKDTRFCSFNRFDLAKRYMELRFKKYSHTSVKLGSK